MITKYLFVFLSCVWATTSYQPLPPSTNPLTPLEKCCVDGIPWETSFEFVRFADECVQKLVKDKYLGSIVNVQVEPVGYFQTNYNKPGDQIYFPDTIPSDFLVKHQHEITYCMAKKQNWVDSFCEFDYEEVHKTVKEKYLSSVWEPKVIKKIVGHCDEQFESNESNYDESAEESHRSKRSPSKYSKEEADEGFGKFNKFGIKIDLGLSDDDSSSSSDSKSSSSKHYYYVRQTRSSQKSTSEESKYLSNRCGERIARLKRCLLRQIIVKCPTEYKSLSPKCKQLREILD